MCVCIRSTVRWWRQRHLRFWFFFVNISTLCHFCETNARAHDLCTRETEDKRILSNSPKSLSSLVRSKHWNTLAASADTDRRKHTMAKVYVSPLNAKCLHILVHWTPKILPTDQCSRTSFRVRLWFWDWCDINGKSMTTIPSADRSIRSSHWQ